MGTKKLIVGLGNPGLQYKNTRHNTGFMFIDRVVKENNGTFKLEKKFKAQIAMLKIEDIDVICCKPMTYMNNSGEAVSAICHYYNIESTDVLVIHDDLDLPVGKIRIREKGSSGGHNGIKSIIEYLQTPLFNRIRIGIDKDANVIDYVLGNFNKVEREKIDNILIIAPLIINDYLSMTFVNLMNKYNQNE